MAPRGRREPWQTPRSSTSTAPSWTPTTSTPWRGSAPCAATTSPGRCGASTAASGWAATCSCPAVAGREVEEAHGDDLREAWAEEFDQLIGEIQPFEGAHELLAEVKERGFRLVLASSGKTEHVEAFLDLIDGKSLADAWTTSDDVQKSKPEPDIVAAALAKVEGASGIMVGDSIYDAQAAAKLGIPTLGVRTGGFSVGELQEAGVLQVFDSLVAFRYALDGTPLARASR